MECGAHFITEVSVTPVDYSCSYKQKLVTPEQAVQLVRSGQWIDYGFCLNHPVALDHALAARMISEPELTGLNFRGSIALWQPQVTLVPHTEDRITWNSWHTSGVERKLMDKGFVFYNPLRYSELPRHYRERLHVDIAMLQAAPMDRHGYFNFGISASHLAAVCECAHTVILEVNPNLPVCLGGDQVSIHISQVDHIVEYASELPQMPSAKPTETDQAVARLILPEIPNGACLQLGIGGMPNAVGAMIAQSDLKDLGVHTEMYVDSFVDMALAGKLTCTKKARDRGRQVFAFAAGSQKLYEYVDQNPSVMAAPVDYVNDENVIASIEQFISINNAVEVDLFGQVASETAGTRHISGAGGQLDFVLGAYRSKGGKSFICCSSTVPTADGGLKSRLTPTLTPGAVVTATRANLHYLVTEFGMVNLKGLASWQRAEAIISVAHPQFREELIQKAEQLKIWRRSNRR